MRDSEKRYIFLVDDEPEVRKVVCGVLEDGGFKVRCFASAAACLRQLHSQQCDLIITDVIMPGMDGLELLTEIKRIMPSLPVLVITGYGDIPMAIKALKKGALDFIQKPLNSQSLISAVESALSQYAGAHPRVAGALTKAEMEVLSFILDGKSTKEIARLRYRSMRTIEEHRHRLMHKLGVDNLVDLVKQTSVVRLVDFK